MNDLLTLDEVAEILRLKANTIRIKIKAGEFPEGLFFKIGGNEWRCDRNDLQAFIEGHKKQTKEG